MQYAIQQMCIIYSSENITGKHHDAGMPHRTQIHHWVVLGNFFARNQPKPKPKPKFLFILKLHATNNNECVYTQK